MTKPFLKGRRTIALLAALKELPDVQHSCPGGLALVASLVKIVLGLILDIADAAALILDI